MHSDYNGASFELAGAGNAPAFPLGNEDPGNGLLEAAGMRMALLYLRRGGRGQFLEHPQFGLWGAHFAVRLPCPL